MTIAFTIPGMPRPAGSKRAFVRGGRAIVVDDNPNSREWKNLCRDAAMAQGSAALLDGPVRLTLTFHLPRPKGHYGTGRNAGSVRASAPAEPTVKPDVLKLARAVEDALSGVVWRDDSQVVDERLRKVYTTGPALVEVEVTDLECRV